jgi:hypothetical protein
VYLLLLVVALIVHGTLYQWHFDLSRSVVTTVAGILVARHFRSSLETMVESISRRWHQPDWEMSDQKLGRRTRRLRQVYPAYRKVED